ncbi:DUF6308 family protein [Demequina sp. B12]|uniref:DUF6308 family protein n=1 Tax=Demequina sp. B12 TaxID=2992757 RepID=UPI00237AFE26|nr:DUF6308 family protein [Demequina sp. B12]MDE0573474.1 DUF6308 family protein [Demequina sp. B12]
MKSSTAFETVHKVLAEAEAMERDPSAVGPLTTYYTLDAYTGSEFETIGGRWDAPEHLNVITPSDLVALATLSVSVTGRAATEILSEPFQEQAVRLLSQIDGDVCIVDASARELLLEDKSVGGELWRLFRPGAASGRKNVDNFGPVRTSKLLARKRPGLFPIYDSVVAKVLGLQGSLNHWTLMHEVMTANGCELWNRAERLGADAGLGAHVTPLRVVDIVLWMHGKSAGVEGDPDQ